MTLAGVLSGTPTALGTYNFTITMSDDNGCVNSQAYAVNVVCPTITVDPASLPNAAQGSSYSQTFTATGGTGTITWSTSAGTLPGGLSLNSSGVLSGTPNATGTFTFTITATRQYGCAGSREYTVVISPCISSFTVNNLGDSADATPGNGICETATGNGVCTLRAAIQEANALPGCVPHTITISGSGTIDLATGLPDLNANMTINGPGAGSLTVRRSTAGGTPDFTVVTIASGRTVTLNGLTISNGKNTIGAGVRNNGILTIESCAITGNTAYNLATGFSALSRGGGIFQSGGGSSLTLLNSTVSGNQSIAETTDANAADAQGGGIQRSSGAITITNSTISGNTAQSITPNGTTGTARGGGFYLSSSGTLTVTNATISNNSAIGGDTANEGGGVFRDAAATGAANFKNTIIAGNNAATGPDTYGTMVSQGFNLIGKADGGAGFTDGVYNDLVGSLASPRNALLAVLGNYGGTTLTHALLPGSPAINAGTATGAPATDQRGTARPQQSLVDIGAFESQGFTLAVTSGSGQTATVNTSFTNPLIVTVTPVVAGEPVNGGEITFTPPGSGASATLASNPATLSSGQASSGTVTANSSAGGPYNVVASATGAASSVNFALTNAAANTAPTFVSVATPSRQQGVPVSNSQIAMINDSETAVGSLIVTVTSANPSNGVTISNIVNTSG
ncbi:MAG TPA: choice-of-anchor Q domain-containing protein, partial [Roseiflexaceae bacterium]|nr:choice-of-anchor Q domain-containing protein [Roseiflexaceae bacterium]